jgi:hypothetical protein
MNKITMIAAFAGMQLVLAVNAAHAGVAPTPVPEPGTMLLLGTSSAAVAVYAWWRNRK